ncbi:MAG: FAD-dependent oxidoreductase [Verrucomicrobiota bacterium]
MTETQHRTTHLIVGAGLAGCLITWRLLEAGQSVCLIGDSTRKSSSSVAAGIINPVTGRWMTKTWNFDQFMPHARTLYRAIEKRLGIEVFHEIPARRYCLNQDDAKRANRRIKNPRYAEVLGDFIPTGERQLGISDPFGSFEIKNAAYVDLPQLLSSLRAYYLSLGCYRDASFDYRLLTQKQEDWQFDSLCTERVIFCEGAAVTLNPWFKHLPLLPIKGETLLFQSDKINLQPGVYHHEKWLLPYGKGIFRIGATYDENDVTDTATEAARSQLLAAAEAFTETKNSIQPVKQLAGIRPTTSDNRPFLGEHPVAKGLYIFNGLGSKGASTAPKLSSDFIKNLLENTPLHPEVSIRRFNQKRLHHETD